MAYTSNVPQGNQQIATTQPLIQANFGFLSTGLAVDHNFNAAGGGSDMYHLKASMPNMANPGSLPGGTNGIYYVNSGAPKFYNGIASFIQTTPLVQQVLTGTVSLNTSSSNVVTLPANSVGCYYIRPPSGKTPCAVGQFVCNGSVLQISQTFDPSMSLSTSGLTLRASLSSSSDNGTYTYLIIYYVP